MTLDEVMEGWRSQDASTSFGVDATLLHQVLRQEQAELEKQWRGARWFVPAVGAFLLITAVLNLVLMVTSNHDDALTVWDYGVGVVGVIAGSILAGAIFALVRLVRSRQAREQGLGDSLRDSLRRRIAQLDDETRGESRLGFLALVAGLIYCWAIPFAMHRTSGVPSSESDWPSPLAIVLILGFLCWVLFRSMPRDRRRKVSRKGQLEALLKELDGE